MYSRGEEMSDKFNHLVEQDKKEYFEEIEIAEQKLQEQMLNNIVRDAKLVCDVYCVPSHNHQAFFCKLFENEKEYIILYAKTFIADRFGFHIAMYTFKDCVKAQNHNGSVGKIICGIKRLSKNNVIIKELLSCLPSKTEWQKRVIMIDGEHTIVRNHLEEETKLLSYSSNAQFTENAYSEDQKVFLENLFLHIEDIIGNVLDYES